MPSWTWNDENQERSDADLDELTPTLNALAAEWSAIHTAEERKGWARQARCEEGDCGPDRPECPQCGGEGKVGLDRNRWVSFGGKGLPIAVQQCAQCWDTKPEALQLVGIQCAYCNGEGIDIRAEAAEAKRQRAVEAVIEVRLEVIEGMLEKYGARMMRPYEHWNEDERYMAWSERDR